jgi:hypothetical protein
MSYKDFVQSKTFNVGHYAVTAITKYLFERFKENTDLDFKPYSDDMNKEDSYGALLITTKFDWETKYRNKRPAIFVSRGNMISGANGTVAQNRVLSITDNGAKTAYIDLVSLPIVVECIAESDIESEALASIVSTYIGLDVRPLRSLRLQIQGGLTQTPPQMFERGANPSFISSVIMQVQISRQYNASIIGEKTLQNIRMQLNDPHELSVTNKG